MEKQNQGNVIYRTPFSKGYWIQAFSELKNVKMLAFAALIIALRVAMKPLRIPIATDVNITFGFIANALGSMVYGPVVALLSGAVSDTVGYIVAPNGDYYFLFIFTEMAGSFVFALYLYRTRVTVWRLILAKFSVNLFVNILLNEPIMVSYYLWLGNKVYQPFMWIRIVKNIVMLPLESIILVVVFKSLIPALSKLGYYPFAAEALVLKKRHIALIAALFLIGAGAVAGYVIYDYNTKSFSASYTNEERLTRNLGMKARVLEENPELRADETVVIIESARSQVGVREMTYSIAVYRIDAEVFRQQSEAAREESGDSGKAYNMDTVDGYSKSKAAKDKALIRIGEGEIVLDKYTGEKISADIAWDGQNE